MTTNRSTVEVAGMSCGHCVAAVTSELGSLDGVTSVDVDLERGVVTYEATRPLGDAELVAAIDAAGFEVVR